jgi:mannose-6-phosphate isomerase-like protein (cupin superfamily)
MEEVRIEEVVPVQELDHWPVMKFAIVSNVWIKMMTFRKAGDYMDGHKHAYDHPTLLTSGSLEVVIDDESTTFHAPSVIFIERGKVHKLIATVDHTMASCIHAIRDGDTIEDIVEEDMIPKGANPRTAIRDLNLKPLTQQEIAEEGNVLTEPIVSVIPEVITPTTK